MSELNNFYFTILEIRAKVRQKAFAAINFAAMKAYCQIDRRILKQEQRFKNFCILQIQFTRSCPFLSAFYSYVEKELAA